MPEDLRSHSLNALQFTLRWALFVFGISITFLHVCIVYLEKTYARISPHYPKKLVYVCFPEEDKFVASYMSKIRTVDFILSIVLAIQCTVHKITSSVPQIHLPIALISAIRFIIVLIEIIHLSSLTGDTQLDFLISVSDGTCKVKENQLTAYRALVAVFSLRCMKEYITIQMASLSYMNSCLIFLFGLRSQPNRPNRDRSEEIGLEELQTRRTNLTA